MYSHSFQLSCCALLKYLLNLKNKENLSEEDILNEIKNQDRMFMMKEKVLRDYKKQTKQQLESI